MRILTLVVLAAALGGCVSTNATPIGLAEPRSAVTPASVAFYRTAEQVGRPYSEVALLNSSGDSLWTTEKKMFESMRREAAKLGADGVILERVKEPRMGFKFAAAVLHVSAPRKGRAIAIRTTPEN